VLADQTHVADAGSRESKHRRTPSRVVSLQ
jgi:hypothetical protein